MLSLCNILMIYNFDLYSVLLAIATNIPVWLKTGFVVIQGHIFIQNSLKNIFYIKKIKMNWMSKGSGKIFVANTTDQIDVGVSLITSLKYWSSLSLFGT